MVDLPTPPLPEATAMIGIDAGNARLRPCRRDGACACAAARPRAAGAAWAGCGPRAARAGGALGGQRHQRRVHARERPARPPRRLAHRLPGLHLRGIDGDREEHLAVGDDDVGQHAAHRSAACRPGAATAASAASTCVLWSPPSNRLSRLRGCGRHRARRAPAQRDRTAGSGCDAAPCCVARARTR